MDYNKIVNMPCLEGMELMMDEKSVDLIVTSPPYNMSREYDIKMDFYDFLEDMEEVIGRCDKVLKDNGAICWQVGTYVEDGVIYPFDIYYHNIFDKLGYKLRNRIIWTYGHGLHCTKRLSGRYETIMWYTKGDEYTFNLDPIRVPQKYPKKKAYRGKRKGQYSCNPKGKNPSDIWDISNVKCNHPEKTSHPCQFPEALVTRLVLALSNEGNVVFDPYMGSGTVAKVCKENDRTYYGFEVNNEYIKIANERLQQSLINL